MEASSFFYSHAVIKTDTSWNLESQAEIAEEEQEEQEEQVIEKCKRKSKQQFPLHYSILSPQPKKERKKHFTDLITFEVNTRN